MKFCFESIQQQSHSLFVDGLAVVPLTRRLYVPENDFLEDTAENHGELELSEQFESTKPLVLSKYFGDLKISLKMSRTVSKKSKDDANIEEINISDEAKSMIEKILGDVSKTSATKQIIIGTTSGWATGFMTMKVGKMAALAFGGGIIMLQIAAHQGYIKVNWDQIQKKAEKISDKVEEKVTGEGPKLLDKVGRWYRINTIVATSFIGGFIIGLAS
ncbi:FUN14 domain-containing protein 1 isoform X2 [Lasioglossum baleicum]|uniref:FUN14 domain-containing protein 1 isoform X2 n=1 Tax=Lasioglossum baleicum TaxID=434251 RepID=UPI003FCD2085